MKRQDAYLLLTKYIKNKNLIRHCLACEAVMKALYKNLYQGSPSYSETMEQTWGTTGLLHDADYEIATATNQLEKHGLLIFNTIACCDQLTGLIVASALIHPDKKLAALTPEFILNRFSSKSFAKGARREPIKQCEEHLGIPLKEFIQISLSAMQEIHEQLGL